MSPTTWIIGGVVLFVTIISIAWLTLKRKHEAAASPAAAPAAAAPKRVSIVMVKADGCPACHAIGPIVTDLAAKHGASLEVYDAAEAPKALLDAHKITSVPSLVINDKVFNGPSSVEAYKAELDSHLSRMMG